MKTNCEECIPCYKCYKTFDCGNGCTNPLRCSIQDKPKDFNKTKPDSWDYRTKKIMKMAKQICPEYLQKQGIYNLLLRKDHVSVVDGKIDKKDHRSPLNMELNYLAKLFDEMYWEGKTKLKWREM